ncbi:MAG: lactonase family protein [Chloroflexi bacterium]|nr:lactonase family protein [Chloroflexota bacterium]
MFTRMTALLIALITFAAAPVCAAGDASKMSSSPQKLMVYVGGYTQGNEQGIYLFHLDLATGELTPAGAGPATVSPSFLAIAPDRRFLYAVNESAHFGGTNNGGVSSFSIDPATGGLAFLNEQSSRGSGPCHIIVDRAGKNVLVANYNSGSVAVLPIEADGRLGEATAFVQHHGSSINPGRQEGPHAHSMNLDAANNYAYAVDLGMDKIMIYRFDSALGTLAPGNPADEPVTPGSGPRHFTFSLDGGHAYVINELGSTVIGYSHDPRTGALKALQTISTLPQGFTGTNHPAEVQISPDGRFLYGSNRGHDSIVIYRIHPDTGLLTLVDIQSSGGKEPRNFRIDPTGQYLVAANQNSGNVVTFRIDHESGKLTPTGHSVDVRAPVCVVMMPIGQ